MKKIIIIAIAFISVFAASAQDKAFKKGNISVDLGVGLAIYGTKVHTEADEQYWTGSGFATRRVAKDTTDGAGSKITCLTGEYGITYWLGIGVRFGYSNYIEETQHDTVNMIAYTYKPKVRSLDAGVMVNFHVIKTKKFDMPICLTLGYSNFKYWENNPNTAWIGQPDNGNAMGKDNGLNYGILLMPKIYFGEHVGMFFNIGYMGYNYPSLAFSNNSDPDINENNNWEYHLKGNGFNIGIGLTAKF